MLSADSLSESDQVWMLRALALAKQAGALGEVPVGALVVLDDRCLAEAYNCSISMHDPSAHAEIMALRSAGKGLKNYRLPGVTLYTTLEPCAMCTGALIHARVQRLVFGASDPKGGAVFSLFSLLDDNRFNHAVEYSGGVLAESCSHLLTEFFRKRRLNRRWR